jgi:predicted ATPase
MPLVVLDRIGEDGFEGVDVSAAGRPLERISLAGYKSIREFSGFTLNKGLNVLIGANGSGKSNFIRFFELLAHIMRGDLQNYVAARGQADAFLFRGAKVTKELSASLEFGRNAYSFSLRAGADRSLFFSSEKAPFDGPLHGKVVNDQGSGHRESALASRSKGARTAAENWVVETLRDWRLYHFHDTSPSSPVMGLSNVVDNDTLHSDAGNIAPFLMRMRTDDAAHFDRVEAVIRQVAPFFQEFALREVAKDQTQLLWRDRFSELTYYPFQLSDGTVRFIALAALLLQPSPPSTIIIDEPELGLHPFAVRLLAGMLHEAAERTQLIVSTQSSALLDELSPEQVVVVNHRDGETRLERLESDRLDDWLTEYTLGQLWEKNTFGGQP